MIDNDEYELSTDLEIDTLLADLPLDLIKENIKEQINDPLSTSIDYVNVITEKCDLIKEQFEDPEIHQTIKNNLRNFFQFVLDELEKRFGFILDLDDEEDEIIALGEAMYNFFILRYRKNISRFIYKFIIKNKKSLADHFESIGKRKDVTSISLKKQIKNKDDILIISNLPNVIKYILSLEVEPLDFLKYAADDEIYEATMIKKFITEGKIAGNFVNDYLNLIKDEYDEILDEIQTDVKLKIIKKI